MPPVLIQEDHTIARVILVLKEMDFTIVQVRMLLTLIIKHASKAQINTRIDHLQTNTQS